MTKRVLFALTVCLPALATDLPPAIPDTPIEYTDISYEEEYTAPDSYTAPAAPLPGPIAAASSERRGYVNFNAYSSDYTVRGMGVRDSLSKLGYSSLSASYTLPNRNLFGKGIQQRISGEYGIIWDSSSTLATPHVSRISYALGKEIFPNLMVELGYTLRHGGLEGYVARHFDGAGHHTTQELSASLTYNDQQRGFFGKAEAGFSFYGLTGTWFDLEAGYRFTDMVNSNTMGADLELSAGVAPSIGYWGSHVEGVDAWRIKAALLPYTHSGSLGRDSRFFIKPWVQFSWAGSNTSEMERDNGGIDLVDDFLITVGFDCGFNF